MLVQARGGSRSVCEKKGNRPWLPKSRVSSSGFDSKEVVAYHVLAQSIIEHASMPVLFCPIVLPHLEGTFTRERNALQSTEFSSLGSSSPTSRTTRDGASSWTATC